MPGSSRRSCCARSVSSRDRRGAPPAPPRRAPRAAADGSGSVLAHVECTVRGQQRAVTVPVSYRLEGGTLQVSGEFPLRQSDLGLTPFTAMLGALAVQDQMRIRIRILARAARTRGAT
jgi:hypothetical protein